MTSPRLARGAARLLAKEDVAERSVTGAQRAETVAAIRGALAARARRRSRARWLAPLAAAAAVAVAVGTAWSLRHSAPVATAPAAGAENVSIASVSGEVVVARGGRRVGLEAHGVIASGESVSALDGQAVFTLRSGSKLDVERQTDLAMSADGTTELVRLERGAVTSHVAKLQGPQRYIVRTADADVEVRGTVFRVSRVRESDCGERTRVKVDEGRVLVRAPSGVTMLDAGGAWESPCVAPAIVAPAIMTPAPTACATPPPVESATSRIAAASPPPPSSRATGAPAPPSPVPAPVASAAAPEAASAPASPASELTAQNALFADAMSAKSRGEAARAVATLDTLLEKYPRTPLREAAEAQRMNLLAGTDHGRAVAAAREYLARYPRGFARADAEKILRDSF